MAHVERSLVAYYDDGEEIVGHDGQPSHKRHRRLLPEIGVLKMIEAFTHWICQ